MTMFSYELKCRECGWRAISAVDDAVARLRIIGQLRRERDPDETLVETLFAEAAPQMTCPICKEKSLFARPSASSDEDFEEWHTAVLCEICREPIAPERLEAIPGTKRCAVCTAKAESGKLDEI